MNVDDKTMGIMGGAVLIFGMIVLYLQLTAGAPSPQPQHQPPNTPAASSGSKTASSQRAPSSAPAVSSDPVIAPGSPCGSTTGSCLADAEMKSEGCEKEKAKEKLMQILANPTNVGGCATIEAQLQQGCAPGCQLDLGSLVIVPGKVEFSIDPLRDALGRCNVKAKRPVRVSADCITSFVQQ